jgi:tRNA (cytidine/uridine-2'-O-)-methyltransferase
MRSMLNIVLFEPEIPPNTGNVIRLATNTGARLALIKPLGFRLDDKHLKRAGLDYREYADMQVYADWPSYLDSAQPHRVFAFSTKANTCYTEPRFRPDDALLFGPETRGLPAELLESLPIDQRLRIPMRENSRSLNLANAVSIATFEAWRQMGFR